MSSMTAAFGAWTDTAWDPHPVHGPHPERIITGDELAEINLAAGGRADEPWLLYLREIGNRWVGVIRLGYNDRLIIAQRGDTTGYAHGWCYSKGPTWWGPEIAHISRGPAFEAAAAWDPFRQDEAPYGWHKRATDRERRIAPHRDPADPDNRARCVHGQWENTPCQWCAPFTGGLADIVP